MTTLNILVPVFFMLILGYISRIKQWVSLEQKNSATTIIFSIFFPILIFHLIANATFELSTLAIIAYVTIMYILAMFIGKRVSGFTGKDKAHFSYYLLATVEGGSVALPLYLSIVGVSSLTVLLDMAGSLVAFFIMPIMIAKTTAQHTSTKALLKSVFSNPFVIAILLGLLANMTQFMSILAQFGFLEMYQGVMNYISGPIGSIILFGLGYDLHLKKETLAQVFRLMLVRVLFYTVLIAGFFILFPDFMALPLNKIGVILYFMCPTGFALPAIMTPVFKTEQDSQFASTFISIYMLVTLTVYSFLVIFMM